MALFFTFDLLRSRFLNVPELSHLSIANETDRLRFSNEPVIACTLAERSATFIAIESARRSAGSDNAKSNETKPRLRGSYQNASGPYFCRSRCSHGFRRFVQFRLALPLSPGFAKRNERRTGYGSVLSRVALLVLRLVPQDRRVSWEHEIGNTRRRCREWL